MNQVNSKVTSDSNRKVFRATGAKNRLKDFLVGGKGDPDDQEIIKSKPLADLFPQATVLFADMVGFTAWSSIREPTQVFTLLENIYRAFDDIARKRGVFKVRPANDMLIPNVSIPISPLNRWRQLETHTSPLQVYQHSKKACARYGKIRTRLHDGFASGLAQTRACPWARHN